VKFIIENGFDIQKGHAAEYQKWMADNEEKITASTPESFVYLGTFANIFNSNPETGSFRTLWATDSYGAMDNFANAMKEGGTFAQLMDTMAGFTLDPQDGGQVSNALSRNITDTAIWGDNT
jgi:hypothetical protein